MSLRRPPALANWLLDRLGATHRNPALAGDLLEEFRGGRSAAWYWRQTLVVVANGIANSSKELWPYLLALGAGYAAQFVATLMLWEKSSPPVLHVSGWMKFGVWLVAPFPSWAYVRWINRMVTGTSRPNLKQMYCAVERPAPKSGIMALAANESFCLGLTNYCMCALIFTRFSLTGLVNIEIIWFGLWVLAPALFGRSAPPPAKTVEDEQPWPTVPPLTPSVSVALPGGRTIILEQQNFAQSVFAARDKDLIAVVFGGGRSLEQIRRAIWVGGYPYIQHRDGSLTLAELRKVIDDVARTKSVTEAWHKRDRREGFRVRLKLWFFGDSA